MPGGGPGLLMRFTIEQRHLTDAGGRPLAGAALPVSFHTFEAESAGDAVQLFVGESSGEIIGPVMNMPGFQAMATVRNAGGVFTLQVTPSSQNLAPLP
jgi:hypothetical protein